MNQELLARLDALAAKMGVASGMLWAAFVRQAYINLLMWVTFDIIFAVAAVLGLRAFCRRYEDDAFLPGAIAVVAAVIFLMGTLDAVGGALNPTYYATSKILGALGGAR